MPVCKKFGLPRSMAAEGRRGAGVQGRGARPERGCSWGRTRPWPSAGGRARGCCPRTAGPSRGGCSSLFSIDSFFFPCPPTPAHPPFRVTSLQGLAAEGNGVMVPTRLHPQ